MKSYQITEQKAFMNLLLCSTVFDRFLLSEAIIHTAASYTICGKLNPDFYSPDELETLGLCGLSYLPYAQLRPVCFSLIKGKQPPTYFKFLLMLSQENLEKTILASGANISADDIEAVFFNIYFKSQQLLLTTGVSYRSFFPDKTFEREWDRFASNFLRKNKII